MSDVTVTPDAPAINVPEKSPAPAPAPVGKSEADGKPEWLDARLERERSKLLKDLGVQSIDDAKKILAEHAAKAEAEKSTAQKAAELETSLKATKAEKESLAAALGEYAKAQMGALTEAQRSAVAAVAGDDPALQLKTINALRPTWASAAAPAAPADTAPPPAAPKGGPVSEPPDAKAIHEELKKTNPVLAARYALANGVFDNK